MASVDMKHNSENLATSDHSQASTAKSVPIYNASSSSHEHAHSCNDPSHHHHHPTYFDQESEQMSSAAAKTEMMMKRKAKKAQRQDVTRAELIPGHRGDYNVDELVNFINGPSSSSNNDGSKKSKKKTPANN